MLLHRLRERTEDYTKFCQLFLEGCCDRDAVEYRIHRNSRQHLLFCKWNTELLVGTEDFRIELIQALQPRLLLRGGIVDDILVIDRSVFDVGPLWFRLRFFERLPVAIRLQSPIQHELGLALLCRNDADDLFVEALRNPLIFDVGDKAPLVIALGKIANGIYVCVHCVLPGTTLTIGTRFPRPSRIAVSRMGLIRSESVTLSSAPRTTWLMILWLSLMGQDDSRSQSPAMSTLHSVRANGPSRAAMTAAMLIKCGSRASVYPPFMPRYDATSRP